MIRRHSGAAANAIRARRPVPARSSGHRVRRAPSRGAAQSAIEPRIRFVRSAERLGISYKELTAAQFKDTDGWKVAAPQDAALPGGMGAAEEKMKTRPSIEDSRAALADLLDKVKLENCRVNEGYLKALGMHAPAVH